MTLSPSSKSTARFHAKAALIAMTDIERATASVAICRKLADAEQYRAAKTVFFYYPVAPEVDVLPLARRALADRKRVAFPRMDWDNKSMSPAAVSALDPEYFETRRHNIPEPLHPPEPTPRPDLVIVPGLAFDRAGNRLGRGAGYYDRYLANHPNIPAIALCFDCQLMDAIPAEPHDIPVRTIFTESESLDF